MKHSIKLLQTFVCYTVWQISNINTRKWLVEPWHFENSGSFKFLKHVSYKLKDTGISLLSWFSTSSYKNILQEAYFDKIVPADL